MAHYAIGDVHGCLPELQRLLEALNFDPAADRLWFVGDLINRGPDSLGVLRLVKGLGDAAVTVLGNHEARLLAAYYAPPESKLYQRHGDYFNADDGAELLTWIRSWPLLVEAPELGWAMTHAGLPSDWSLATARYWSRRVEDALRDAPSAEVMLSNFPRSLPQRLPEADAPPWEPLRFALIALTHIRVCNPEGTLLWPKEAAEMGLEDPYGVPPLDFPYQPWHGFRDRYQRDAGEPRIVYGHWAAAGLTVTPHTVGLDSGCVYGGALSAIRLDDPQAPITAVPSSGYFSR
ncbi:symmetrical bis(5'-nucleosyl)-tetraphosphatase [Magnetofaba australis]|uniref:bis(5'-nucleosyl)-tetraphosphatase (symmetrical) n=1 Tax=Magnetofaba australis IT-1 TaxID=1434232 RepID=A0A1Y2K2R7_9PROT|nr:symmetrical bis(5'-nucleosyl)-tetraphosphatase [Magnetofaba australis]OSM02328.1 putative diadenosine tetraphosphatase [Magnetofaba australis IT-1]